MNINVIIVREERILARIAWEALVEMMITSIIENVITIIDDEIIMPINKEAICWKMMKGTRPVFKPCIASLLFHNELNFGKCILFEGKNDAKQIYRLI